MNKTLWIAGPTLLVGFKKRKKSIRGENKGEREKIENNIEKERERRRLKDADRSEQRKRVRNK